MWCGLLIFEPHRPRRVRCVSYLFLADWLSVLHLCFKFLCRLFLFSAGCWSDGQTGGVGGHSGRGGWGGGGRGFLEAQRATYGRRQDDAQDDAADDDHDLLLQVDRKRGKKTWSGSC